MSETQIEAVQFYNLFEKFGFKAGITLKGNWENEDAVYKYISDELIPARMQMIVPTQVHGADILVIESEKSYSSPIVDGTISKRNDICLTVTTADCVPLIFADPVSGIFGAVHVGWRSYIAGILDYLFQTIDKSHINIDDMHVHIGPSIGPCCFEVGGEVAVLFDEDVVIQKDGKCFVDLNRAIRNKLSSLGIEDTHISGLFECTSCFTDRYYSYRRDKESPIQLVSFVFKST